MNAAWLQTSNSTEENADSKEQNPFEQSFSTTSVKPNPLSVPRMVSEGNAGLAEVWDSDTSSYSYDSNSLNNDISSVSDHQATSEDSDDAFRAKNPMTFEQQRPKGHSRSNSNALTQQQQHQYQTRYVNSHVNSPRQSLKDAKKRARSVKVPEDEEKRKNFLERNRLAALKCRQRKKQWLTNLQARDEYLADDNDQLQMEINLLRKEILDIKTLLVTHKECPQYNTALAANHTVIQHQPQQPVYHHNFPMNK
ncbi:hypothetical protein MFLAVUS_010158 [Mucor flavus]|uniref:BZIP domain-containing protein n=1 Tax=Mucor flavus TaxID=439312 RepID=A0ABP9ZBX7_9FUNG